MGLTTAANIGMTRPVSSLSIALEKSRRSEPRKKLKVPDVCVFKPMAPPTKV